MVAPPQVPRNASRAQCEGPRPTGQKGAAKGIIKAGAFGLRPDHLSSFFGAPAAEVERELLRLLARVRVEDDLAYADPAIVAGVGVLVLVVLLFGRWVRGCARLSGVHSSASLPFCGPGPGELHLLRDHLFIRRPNPTTYVA
jgi:hypothetical protein